MSALRRPSEVEKKLDKRAEERGTEGKNDTACYHRHTVEFAVGKSGTGNKEIKTAVLRRIRRVIARGLGEAALR